MLDDSGILSMGVSNSPQRGFRGRRPGVSARGQAGSGVLVDILRTASNPEIRLELVLRSSDPALNLKRLVRCTWSYPSYPRTVGNATLGR